MSKRRDLAPSCIEPQGKRGGLLEVQKGSCWSQPAGLARQKRSQTRMWLWFLTSFHSQLSDRFLLRWYLLHDNAQKCGTVQKWGSCYPTCQAVSVTSSPLLVFCDSKTTTTAIAKVKHKPNPCKNNALSHHHHCSTSLHLCLLPCLLAPWPIYFWSITVSTLPVQTCWCTAVFSSHTGATFTFHCKETVDIKIY